MKQLVTKIRLLSNIATILIAIFLGCIVFKLFTSSAPLSIQNKSPINPLTLTKPNETSAKPVNNAVGKQIPLQNVDWQKNKKTLVLFVSPTCHFCTESKQFYKKLVDEHSNKGTKFVAVTTSSIDEGKSYLNQLGVKISDVYQSSLNAIGVDGTPTLLLVDENGVVTDAWVGKLPEDRENQVISKL